MNITTQRTILVRFAQLLLGTISLAVAINAVAVDTNSVPVAGGSPDGYKSYVSGDSSSLASVMNIADDKIAQSIAADKTPHSLSDKPQRDGNSSRTPYLSDGYEGYPDVPFYSFPRE